MNSLARACALPARWRERAVKRQQQQRETTCAATPSTRAGSEACCPPAFASGERLHTECIDSVGVPHDRAQNQGGCLWWGESKAIAGGEAPRFDCGSARGGVAVISLSVVVVAAAVAAPVALVAQGEATGVK